MHDASIYTLPTYLPLSSPSSSLPPPSSNSDRGLFRDGIFYHLTSVRLLLLLLLLHRHLINEVYTRYTRINNIFVY